MSYECFCDSERRLVRIVVRGQLTRGGIVSSARQISLDARISEFDHLIDLRQASSTALTGTDVVALASASLGTRARQAIVAGDQVTYGLARMFQTYRDTHRSSGRVGVFRDLDAAESWLQEEPAAV